MSTTGITNPLDHCRFKTLINFYIKKMSTFYSVHLCLENVDVNYNRIESSVMSLEIQFPSLTKKNVTI